MKLSNRAQVVIATTAVLLSLTACGQKEEATVGQKIDAAMTSTEQAALQARQDMESTAADIKREGEQAVQSVTTAATDMAITTQVKAALAADDQLSALKIEVDTVQGVVSLTGPAPSAEAAERATTLAKAVEGAELVYFSGITLAILAPRARGRLLGAIVKARDNGAKIAFDTNLRPALWTSPRVMAGVLTAAASLCDIVLPTHTDEAPLFGDKSVDDTADRYLELGVEEVVVKDGSKEALIATASERVRIAPPPVTNVVDATGAGDSFNGAYLSARLNGKSMREAAEAAHRTAGIVIGHKGALVDPKLVQD